MPLQIAETEPHVPQNGRTACHLGDDCVSDAILIR